MLEKEGGEGELVGYKGGNICGKKDKGVISHS